MHLIFGCQKGRSLLCKNKKKPLILLSTRQSSRKRVQVDDNGGIHDLEMTNRHLMPLVALDEEINLSIVEHANPKYRYFLHQLRQITLA